jgi:hypothetical protein
MIYPDLCRKTFEGAVHGFCGISRGVRKLARTPTVLKIKNKIKKEEKFMMKFLLNNKSFFFFFFNAIFKSVLISFTISYISE